MLVYFRKLYFVSLLPDIQLLKVNKVSGKVCFRFDVPEYNLPEKTGCLYVMTPL